MLWFKRGEKMVQKWKCKKSKTGFHSWKVIERPRASPYNILQCKYCKRKKYSPKQYYKK